MRCTSETYQTRVYIYSQSMVHVPLVNPEFERLDVQDSNLGSSALLTAPSLRAHLHVRSRVN